MWCFQCFTLQGFSSISSEFCILIGRFVFCFVTWKNLNLLNSSSIKGWSASTLPLFLSPQLLLSPPTIQPSPSHLALSVAISWRKTFNLLVVLFLLFSVVSLLLSWGVTVKQAPPPQLSACESQKVVPGWQNDPLLHRHRGSALLFYA